MSKLTKLIKDPKQFFLDVRPVRYARKIVAVSDEVIKSSKSQPAAKAKSTAKAKAVVKAKPALTVKAKPAVKTKSLKNTVVDNMEQIKNSLNSIVNEIPVANVNFRHYQVALYFSGSMGNIYQLEQWIGPLNAIHDKTPVVIITRVKAVYDWASAHTDFVAVYCRTIQDLTSLYENSNFKCILYVNHGFKNFQSLMNHKALHVHINHGESDKTSTITNQAKSYDYVYVVAQAGFDKYDNNLINKDMSKFIKIGRPQLEHIPKIEGFKTEKTVVLYAPTWEGTHESMNFSSLQEFGLSIVQQLINHPNYFVVYKPHPNTGSRDANIKNINQAIIDMLNEQDDTRVYLSGDINSIYPHVDMCIFDNSAVAIDYLKVDKPMLMTDMFYKVKGRLDTPIITGAARMIKKLDSFNITNIIQEELEQDTKQVRRQEIKQYFIGNFDYDNNESTSTFVSKILDVCAERDLLINESLRIQEEARLEEEARFQEEGRLQDESKRQEEATFNLQKNVQKLNGLGNSPFINKHNTQTSIQSLRPLHFVLAGV